MCNLYSQRSATHAIMDLANAMRSDVGNLAPGDVIYRRRAKRG